MFRTYENLTRDHIEIQSLVEDWAKANSRWQHERHSGTPHNGYSDV